MANKDLTGTVAVPAEGSVLPDSYAYEQGESRAGGARADAGGDDRTIWPTPGRSVRRTSRSRRRDEALTLASIVEKETAIADGAADGRGRLFQPPARRACMLQADPTIIYPITKGKPLGRRIRKSEIAAVNDYNTYAMTGLPKGPIANPGRASIEAVLHPADTNALYFVADGKGGHVFADTLEQHNANVAQMVCDPPRSAARCSATSEAQPSPRAPARIEELQRSQPG